MKLGHSQVKRGDIRLPVYRQHTLLKQMARANSWQLEQTQTCTPNCLTSCLPVSIQAHQYTKKTKQVASAQATSDLNINCSILNTHLNSLYCSLCAAPQAQRINHKNVKRFSNKNIKKKKKCLSLTLKYIYAEALTTSRGPSDCQAHQPKKKK